MKTSVYRYLQNTDAQHQAVAVEMAAGHVFIVNSSKGISSVYLVKWIGISQKSAWKIGHTIRKMMDQDSELIPKLNGFVEFDEKYIGGKPRYQKGQIHPRGKGTQKQ